MHYKYKELEEYRKEFVKQSLFGTRSVNTVVTYYPWTVPILTPSGKIHAIEIDLDDHLDMIDEYIKNESITKSNPPNGSRVCTNEEIKEFIEYLLHTNKQEAVSSEVGWNVYAGDIYSWNNYALKNRSSVSFKREYLSEIDSNKCIHKNKRASYIMDLGKRVDFYYCPDCKEEC